MRNMQLHPPARGAREFFSAVMRKRSLASPGVFLPLEVALNGVWGVRQNRSYVCIIRAISLGLAFAVGVLAMASVASTASQQTILSWIFIGHTDNVVFRFISYGFLRLCADFVRHLDRILPDLLGAAL